MTEGCTRRTFLKGAVGSTAIIGLGAAGCGITAPPAVNLLNTVTITAAAAFGTSTGGRAVDAIPALFKSAVERARTLAGNGPILGRYNPGDLPDNQLQSIVSAIHRAPYDSGTSMRATTVHGIQDYGLEEVPAVVQLGLNMLVFYLAGYDGDYLDADEPFTSSDLEILRRQNTIYTYSLVSGTDYINEPGTYRAVTMSGDRTVEIEWEPSPEDPTTHSRLAVRKGKVVQGLAPSWDVDRYIAVPFRYIFELDEPLPTVPV